MSLAYRILRSYRGYILPSHHRTFQEVVRAGGPQADDGASQFVYFDFVNPEIDLDAGRYIFALVRDFELNGYTAAYRRHFPFLSNMRYKRYKALLLEKPYRVVNSVADLPKGSVVALVTDRKRFAIPGAKLLRVSYEGRLPRSDAETLLPYRPYPNLYSRLPLSPDFDSSRKYRLFFAGTVNKRYRRTLGKFAKMSRVEILEKFGFDLASAKTHLLIAENQGSKNPHWEPSPSRIPLENWFASLAKSDFFLACPGGVMPICHNVVEALAVGSVPILEYPEYLDPPLQHGLNCLAFSGPESLRTIVQSALEMDPAKIKQMRLAAVDYYQRHLAPGNFAREFLTSPRSEMTLLFNAHMASRLPKS